MSVTALDTEEDTVVTPGDRVLLGCRISVGPAFTGEGLFPKPQSHGGRRWSETFCGIVFTQQQCLWDT